MQSLRGLPPCLTGSQYQPWGQGPPGYTMACAGFDDHLGDFLVQGSWERHNYKQCQSHLPRCAHLHPQGTPNAHKLCRKSSLTLSMTIDTCPLSHPAFLSPDGHSCIPESPVPATLTVWTPGRLPDKGTKEAPVTSNKPLTGPRPQMPTVQTYNHPPDLRAGG